MATPPPRTWVDGFSSSNVGKILIKSSNIQTVPDRRNCSFRSLSARTRSRTLPIPQPSLVLPHHHRKQPGDRQNSNRTFKLLRLSPRPRFSSHNASRTACSQMAYRGIDKCDLKFWYHQDRAPTGILAKYRNMRNPRMCRTMVDSCEHPPSCGQI